MVVFWLKSEGEGPLRDPYGTPEFCEWLYESAVVLIAVDDDHHQGFVDHRIPPVGQGRSCSRFHYTTCEEHQRLRKRLKKWGKRNNSLMILIYSPRQEILLSSVNRKGGAKLPPEHFDRHEFDGDVLERAQRRIGAPAEPMDLRPYKSALKAEAQALFGPARSTMLKGVKGLLDQLERLPKKLSGEEAAWARGWLEWRCGERLGLFLDKAAQARRPRARRKAYDTLARLVRGHPKLSERVAAAREERQ